MTRRKWRPDSELWHRRKPFVRKLRTSQTQAEEVLWERLRRKQVAGVRFRRQHAIGPFVVDFYCGKAKLIVELDGPIHLTQVERDRERQAYLEGLGFVVIRFTNDEVFSSLDDVVLRIENRVMERLQVLQRLR